MTKYYSDYLLEELKTQLDRIEKKLDEREVKHYLNLKDVCEYTGLSNSTIHRAIEKGELKCSKKIGKLLFTRENVRKWLGK